MQTHQCNDSSSLRFPELPLPNRFSTIEKGVFRRIITSSERQAISQGVIDAIIDLKTYQAEIDRLMEPIIMLRMKRSSLKKKMTAYRSLLSPVHRMPPEILAHIFWFSCDNNYISMKDNSPYVITLSAVCGRWREIVLSIPHLWSPKLSIGFCMGADSVYSRHFCYLMEIFMERSKTELLDLEFCGLCDKTCAPYEAGLNCLINQSHRWRQVAFKAYCPISSSPSPFQELRGPLPHLRHLCLSGHEISFADDLALFSESPLLTSIEVAVRALPPSSGFPWAQIRASRLRGNNLSHVLQTIVLCKNVQHLELFRDGNEESDSWEAGSVTVVDKLEYLYVDFDERKDYRSAFFHSLTLPSLSALRIRGNGFEPKPWDPTPLADLLRRSTCSLTELSLESVSLSDKAAIELITLIPTLNQLVLEERESYERTRSNKLVTVALVEQLVMNVGDKQPTGFLPRLQKLTLRVWPLNPSAMETLRRVLASRRTVLRAFSLTVGMLGEQSDVSDYESLRCFRDDGMRIRISFRGYSF